FVARHHCAECGARQGLAIRAMANQHLAGVDFVLVVDLAAVATPIDLHGVKPRARVGDPAAHRMALLAAAICGAHRASPLAPRAALSRGGSGPFPPTSPPPPSRPCYRWHHVTAMSGLALGTSRTWAANASRPRGSGPP